MRPIPIVLAAAALAAASGAASAQDFAVVPQANANERGNGGLNTLVRDSGNPRTYQQQFTEAELAAQGLMPGMPMTGITWRASITSSNPATWPPAGGATWDDYEITFAQAANPISNMSSTFADNMLNPVMVQSGSLHIPENSFANDNPAAPDPNPWGPEIAIAPYTYQGGDLVVLYSHNGSDINSNIFLDRVSSDDAWGRAISASSFQAPTGGSPTSSFIITRFSFVPAPGASALFGICGLVALRRRR